ncbi:MAG: hypothetical protein MJ252_03230 [archaeon]|nr:hypothetical protein [archaeon]
MIGKAKRGVVKDEQFPGAGKYEHKVYMGLEGPKYTMARKYDDAEGRVKERRSKLAKPDVDSPGPGYYDIQIKDSSPKYTIRKKLGASQSMKELRRPEVGDYNLRSEDFLEGLTGNKFTKSKRDDLIGDEKTNSKIGPGTYSPMADFITTSSPKFGFSKDSRFKYKINDKKNPSSPGPGKYEHKTFFGIEGVPHFTFYKDKKFNISKYEENKNPAPNKYFNDISYKTSTPVYTMPKSTREQYNVNKVFMSFPGPTKYSPQFQFLSRMLRVPHWGVGTGDREEKKEFANKIKAISDSVGPGRYNLQNGVFPGGPKYTIRLRMSKSQKNYCPSPTRYNPGLTLRPKEPIYSIGKEERGDDLKQIKKDDYPGPGKYNIKDSTGTTTMYSFPKAAKQKELTLSNLGQGKFYKIPCSFNDLNDFTRNHGTWDPQYKWV